LLTNYSITQDLAQTVSITELEKAGFFQNDSLDGKKDDGLCHNSLNTETSVVDAPPPGIATQSRLLFLRELHHMHRDWTVTFSRVVVSSVVGLFLGMLFLDVGDTDRSDRILLQSYLGGVMIILCAMMIVQMQVSMFVIPDERPIFLREFSTNHYAVLSYMVSHLLAEAVLTAVQVFILLSLVYWTMGLSGRFVVHFLSTFAFSLVTAAQAVLVGCLAGNNVKLAIQMQPLLIVPQMLFSGFFLPTDMMPDWLAWLQHLCTMVYSARIMVVEEFEHCSDIPAEQANCDDMIKATAADPNDVWWYWLVLAMMYVVYRTLAVVVLRKSALRFY
jgi:ABC-type multidrug transport system permease subunit